MKKIEIITNYQLIKFTKNIMKFFHHLYKKQKKKKSKPKILMIQFILKKNKHKIWLNKIINSKVLRQIAKNTIKEILKKNIKNNVKLRYFLN